MNRAALAVTGRNGHGMPSVQQAHKIFPGYGKAVVCAWLRRKRPLCHPVNGFRYGHAVPVRVFHAVGNGKAAVFRSQVSAAPLGTGDHGRNIIVHGAALGRGIAAVCVVAVIGPHPVAHAGPAPRYRVRVTQIAAPVYFRPGVPAVHLAFQAVPSKIPVNVRGRAPCDCQRLSA